jgi:hypothetical protein
MATPSFVVPRHEHEFESRVGAAWCIGHTTPFPWEHVHSTAAVPLGMPAHSATGAEPTITSWATSQAPASLTS